MTTVLNEPRAEYGIKSWQNTPKIFSIEDNICEMDPESIKICFSFNLKYSSFFKRPTKKLSSLRGKHTKQSEKEIDDQISELRSEWERNF